MFRQAVYVIDPIPMEYVQNLQRLDSEPDYALTCLGIALLKSRFDNYPGIGGGYQSSTHLTSCVDHFIERTSHAADFPRFYYYRFSYLDNEEEQIKKLKDAGFTVKESIGTLMRQKNNVICYAVYKENENTAGIFIDSSDIKLYHFLISTIPLLFPKLFKDKPIQKPDEHNLLKTLTKTDENSFIDKIREMVTPYAEEFRKMMIARFMRNIHQEKVARAKAEMDEAEANHRYYEDETKKAYQAWRDKLIVYEGMKIVEAYDDTQDEFVNYLTLNKQLYDLRMENGQLKFSVKARLINYNSEAWEGYAARGYILDGNYGATLHPEFAESRANRELFLRALFCENPEMEIQLCSNYVLDLTNCYVEALKRYDYDKNPAFANCLPNPHIKIFGCLGGYKGRMVRALKDKEYESAIELCVASAGSLDFDETEQTFRPFLGWLMSSDKKCIVMKKDGKEITPKEALAYLLEKENNK